MSDYQPLEPKRDATRPGWLRTPLEQHAGATIAGIFDGKIRASDVKQPHLQAICRGYEATKHNRRAKLAFKRLVLHVQRLKGFFDHRPALSHLGWQTGNTYFKRCTAVRNLETEINGNIVVSKQSAGNTY